jgi:hypothetical protein
MRQIMNKEPRYNEVVVENVTILTGTDNRKSILILCDQL